MKEVKALFFNETLKRWHFEAIVKSSDLSRERVNHFVKILLKEGFIKRIKPKGKMPFYLANRESPKFRTEKKLFGLMMLNELFEHLSPLNIKTAILFGSFARGDWNRSSDIDLFIYGDANGFDKAKFESKLKREIQLFAYNEKQKIDLDKKVIPNIAKGFYIKDSIQPLEVSINV